MKATSLRHLCCLVVLPLLASFCSAADDKSKADQSPDLTLEDVIFDAKYLKQVLGAKTLVAPAEKTGEFPTAAIAKAGLDEKTKIYALPAEAAKPVLKSSFTPTYPQSLRLRRESIKASFLLFVGADGNVKCLYCYDTNDQVYAIATADAVIKWRYTPARIGNTAVPAIVPLEMNYAESSATIGTFNAPRSPLSVKGNPAPPRPVRPGANQAPR